MNVDLGLQGLLVWSTDAGELGNFSLTGLFVKTLGITLLSDLDGNVDPNLDEGDTGITTGPLSLVQLTGQVAISSVWADEAGDGDGGGIGEEFGDLGDTADVLFPVLGRETEIFVQAEADVVAIEAIGGLVVGFSE